MARTPIIQRYGLAIAMATATCGALGGCASNQPLRAGSAPPEAVRSALVLPGEPMVAVTRRCEAMERGWEYSRNDPPPERAQIPQFSEFLYLEQRHIEHLRTTNARPREHSSTTTRTIRRSLIVR